MPLLRKAWSSGQRELSRFGRVGESEEGRRRVGGWEGVQVNRARIPCYANLLHGSFPGFRLTYFVRTLVGLMSRGGNLISDGRWLDWGMNGIGWDEVERGG